MGSYFSVGEVWAGFPSTSLYAWSHSWTHWSIINDPFSLHSQPGFIHHSMPHLHLQLANPLIIFSLTFLLFLAFYSRLHLSILQDPQNMFHHLDSDTTSKTPPKSKLLFPIQYSHIKDSLIDSPFTILSLVPFFFPWLWFDQCNHMSGKNLINNVQALIINEELVERL